MSYTACSALIRRTIFRRGRVFDVGVICVVCASNDPGLDRAAIFASICFSDNEPGTKEVWGRRPHIFQKRV